MRILAPHHIKRGLGHLFSDELFITTNGIRGHRHNKIFPACRASMSTWICTLPWAPTRPLIKHNNY